jgi:hypothetical protein
MITAESARVYRGATRRWFTLRAAINDIVRHEIKTIHCECDKRKHGDEPQYVCSIHRDKLEYDELAKTIRRRVLDEHNANLTEAPEVGG